MFRRPKVGETEEDLLRQEKEFLKASGGQPPPIKRKIEQNESATPKQFEILSDIEEKKQESFKPIESNLGQAKGFPEAFIIPSTLFEKKKGKMSLFAMQLKRNQKVAKEEMDVDETSSASCTYMENSLSDCLEDRKKVQEENLEKLSKLSAEEILEEQSKLLKRLDPKLIEFLKKKGKEKVTYKREKVEEKSTTEVDEEEVKKNLEKYMDSKWVNMDFLEKEKLEWIGEIPDRKALESDQPYSARFDFKGELQPFSQEIDVRNSLYHHGEEPNRPGYTIQELYQLSRSQVLQQRNIALTTLANIIRKTKLGYYDRCFDGQMLHKLVESNLFFLLRFSIDENSSVPASIYCLHNLLCDESDEFCLDKLLGVTYADEQPLLYNKIEAHKEEEKELKDHVVIGYDMIKGVLRTDLLIRLSYVLNNFSLNRETIFRAINCLIRISRHSLEAATTVLETKNLISFVYNNVRTDAPVYEGVKLFRVMITHSENIAKEIVQKYDLQCLVSFIEAEENANISKKEFYLLKLETFYFWRGLLLHDFFIDEFVMWSPCLTRLLLFYTQKVDVSSENEFDFELFSALSSLIIVCNNKKITPDPNIPVMMRICLEKWLTQLLQYPQYNFSVSKALGCAFRYFTSHFKAFGVNALDLKFLKKINSILVLLHQSEAFDKMSCALRQQSYLLSSTEVNRYPDNLPSLCSVYDGGDEFLRIVENSSSLPFFISLAKFLKAAHRISHDSEPVIKLFVNSKNIRKYISKVCGANRIFYSWFMKFETGFLAGFLNLLLLVGDEEVLKLGFCLLPLLRVDDPKSRKVLEVVCDRRNWKVEENYLDRLASLYAELMLVKRKKTGMSNYKNSLIPEDWSFKSLSLLRGKENTKAVANVLMFLSVILAKNSDLIKKIPYTYRFYNLCFVFLSDSNVFDLRIQTSIKNIFLDVIANQEKVNLNLKFDKNKSFYDLYTELITQYAGVSYGLPVFAEFVLFPLQNRFTVSLRKLIWFEYLHVLRVVTLPFPADCFIGLEGFLEPCETDESLLVAYINSVSNGVILKSKNPFVYNIAVGNVSRFLGLKNQDEKLLMFLRKKINELKNEELKNDILGFSVSQ